MRSSAPSGRQHEAGRRQRGRRAACPRRATAAAVRRRSASSRDNVSVGEKRRIAVEHEHILDRALRREAAIERPQRRAHRIAGAERRILHDALGRRDGPGDLLHLRPDHDDVAAGDSGRNASRG